MSSSIPTTNPTREIDLSTYTSDGIAHSTPINYEKVSDAIFLTCLNRSFAVSDYADRLGPYIRFINSPPADYALYMLQGENAHCIGQESSAEGKYCIRGHRGGEYKRFRDFCEHAWRIVEGSLGECGCVLCEVGEKGDKGGDVVGGKGAADVGTGGAADASGTV